MKGILLRRKRFQINIKLIAQKVGLLEKIRDYPKGIIPFCHLDIEINLMTKIE